MYLTEEEARKKWCPMAREIAIDDRAFSTRGKVEDRYTCIASECMMWREYDTWHHEAVMKSLDLPYEKPEKTGYCGLGGKP